MPIETVGVVGLGTMGAGIAEVFARNGLAVVAIEVDHAALSAGRGRLDDSLQRAVDRGRLDEAKRDEILEAFTFSTDLGRLADADLVIEAVPERLEIKTELFGHVDHICAEHTILATNTSSLPVTQVAAATGRPDRVVGMHFFNPAPVMKLVEVVHTVLTDPAVTGAVQQLAAQCGKTPVVVTDRAGFVVNALLFGYLNQAARMVETGHASVEDVDAAMTLACGLPMGPLTLMDLIGLDVCLEVLEVLWDEKREQRYAPAPMLRRLVMARHLGRKTGRGYYAYDGKSAHPAVDLPVAEPVRPGRGKTCRVVVTGDDGATQLAKRLGASAGEAGDADVVVNVPAAPRPGQVVEVAAVTTAGAAAVPDLLEKIAAANLGAVRCRARPGYVVEALLFGHLDDAVRMVDDGYATGDDVDAAMRLGCGYPDGPWAMLDSVGPAVVRDGLERQGVAPSPLLAELAASTS